MRGRVRIEAWVVGLFFLSASGFLGFYLWSDINRNADTAQTLVLTESIGRYGIPYNQVGVSVLEADRTWGKAAQDVCQDPLLPGPESYPNGQFSHFEEHAYYFAYLLGPLTRIVPVAELMAWAYALAMMAVPVLCYWVLRKERVNVLGSAVFCGLLVAYPVWNQALQVNLYYDRFFPPLGLAYLALLYYSFWGEHSDPRLLRWAIPVGILAASTNDRSMLYIIAISTGVVVLLGRRVFSSNRAHAFTLIVFSVMVLAAFISYEKFVFTWDVNSIGGFTSRFTSFYSQLRSSNQFRFGQTYSELTQKFLAVNFVFFGTWCFLQWRTALLAAAATLPNILGTLGGAEKITFGFPYHSHYFPILAFASALGFAAIWRRYKIGWAQAAIGAFTALSASALIAFDPYQQAWAFSQAGVQQSGLYGVLRFYVDGPHSSVAIRASQMAALARAIPLESSVTSVEGAATVLRDRHWFYYPMGIDIADYAVLVPTRDEQGGPYFAGAISYLGQGRELDLCLNARLGNDGYDLANPGLVGPFAILHRLPSAR